MAKKRIASTVLMQSVFRLRAPVARASNLRLCVHVARPDWPGQLELLNERAEAGDVAGAEAIFAEIAASVPHRKKTMLYNTVLKACANQGAQARAAHWFRTMRGERVRVNDRTFGKLAEAGAKCGDPAAAQRWLRRLGAEADAAKLNMLIDACAQAGMPTEAAQWLEQMQLSRVQPDMVSYNSVIKAYSRVGQASTAELWLFKASQSQLHPTAVTFRSLIDAYAKLGKTEDAERCLRAMGVSQWAPDLVAHNSLINACAKASQPLLAVAHFERLAAQRLRPDVVTFTGLAESFARAGRPAEASDWLRQAATARLQLNAVPFNIVIAAWGRAGDLAAAEKLLKQMAVEGLVPTLEAFNSLMHSCALRGDVSGASAWLSQAAAARLEPDAVSYTCIINACAQARDPDGALSWFRQMLAAHVRPTEVTCGSLVHACARAGRAQDAVLWLRRFQAHRLSPGLIAYTSALAACRDSATAEGGADEVRKLAEGLLEELLAAGLRPDRPLLRVVAQVLGPERLGAPGLGEVPAAEKPRLDVERRLARARATDGVPRVPLALRGHSAERSWLPNALALRAAEKEDSDQLYVSFPRLQFFVPPDVSADDRILKGFVEKLQGMRSMVSGLGGWRFWSTSLLFLFDEQDLGAEPEVKMIDFAHCARVQSDTPDEEMLCSLWNIETFLQALMDAHPYEPWVVARLGKRPPEAHQDAEELEGAAQNEADSSPLAAYEAES
ncbi:unnamed protein product [Polarella glacialis]|uniref:PROP1-like PPR domain-containing protein n=1 Tax=Polarella glacialis TaxID=89957 RepID=A0A813GKX7_POLGL|nr:unnamed protein product [Polarella glacialis]